MTEVATVSGTTLVFVEYEVTTVLPVVCTTTVDGEQLVEVHGVDDRVELVGDCEMGLTGKLDELVEELEELVVEEVVL